MTRPDGFNPFMSFRFVVFVPETRAIIGASQVHSDPFNDALWIARAHMSNERTLGQHLADTTKIDVYLFQRMLGPISPDLPIVPSEPVRRIAVSFAKCRPYPLDLDATRAAVALEWVALDKATYGTIEDLTMVDLPPEVWNSFRR